MAREVERIIRSEGATPATVAILRGVPHVGLTDDQLEYLAREGTKVREQRVHFELHVFFIPCIGK
jgi:pseudouridine-5'-phosphate glycosidase